MAELKKFECIIFRPEFGCDYTVSGEKDDVIDQAAIHEQNEHEISDTPETRKEIEDSLIDNPLNP